MRSPSPAVVFRVRASNAPSLLVTKQSRYGSALCESYHIDIIIIYAHSKVPRCTLMNLMFTFTFI